MLFRLMEKGGGVDCSMTGDGVNIRGRGEKIGITAAEASRGGTTMTNLSHPPFPVSIEEGGCGQVTTNTEKKGQKGRAGRGGGV